MVCTFLLLLHIYFCIKTPVGTSVEIKTGEAIVSLGIDIFIYQVFF